MTDLPPGWAEASVGTIASSLIDGPFGSNLKSEHYQSSGVRVIRLQNIADGRFDDRDKAYISLDHFNKLNRHEARPGDVLIAALGDVLPRVCLVPPDIDRAIVKADCFRLRPYKGISANYLAYILSAPQIRKRASTEIAGVGRPRLNLRKVSDLVIPVPPSAEQERIVAAIEEQFSRLDAGVAALERARRNLKRMRAAVLHAAVTGRLVETERGIEPAESIVHKIKMLRKSDSQTRDSVNVPGDLPSLPDGWCWTTIGELFDVFVGSTPSRNDLRLWAGEVPWVSSGEVAFGRIRMTRENISEAAVGNKDTRLHPPGTVMLAMIGEGKTRGQAAILDIEAAHNQNCASIRVSVTPVLPEYVYWVLTERYERTRIMASGGNQLALNSKRVKAIPLPLPPIETQKLIVAEIERRETILAATLSVLDITASRSAVLRSSILSTAFSGKLVAQDVSDESASTVLERIAAERALSNGRSPARTRKPRTPQEKVVV